MSIFFGNQKGNDTFAIQSIKHSSLKSEKLIFLY
jgi:hypothetical protein